MRGHGPPFFYLFIYSFTHCRSGSLTRFFCLYSPGPSILFIITFCILVFLVQSSSRWWRKRQCIVCLVCVYVCALVYLSNCGLTIVTNSRGPESQQGTVRQREREYLLLKFVFIIIQISYRGINSALPDDA